MTLVLQTKSAECLSLVEKTEIEQSISQLISSHQDNRAEINKLTMESITCLAVSEARAGELVGQGFFKRLAGNITGKNSKLRVDIDRNVARSQYAAQQTIQKLAEQNLFTFDLVTAVNNKLNALMIETNEDINQLYKSLNLFFKKTRSDMLQAEARLDKLERNVNLLHWNSTIEYRMFGEREYSELNDIEKLICLTNDFYVVSDGNWSTQDLMLLKSALSEIGLDLKRNVAYKDFFLELIKDSSLVDRFFENVDLTALPHVEVIEASVVKALEKASRLDTEEKYIYDTIAEQMESANLNVVPNELKLSIIKNYLKNNADMLPEREVSVYDFVLELLVNLETISEADAFSIEQVALVEAPKVVETLELKVGDFVEFGSYKEWILKWRIIHSKEGHMLLFYEGVIQEMSFDSFDWENSSVRKFLNTSHLFLKEFKYYERDAIIKVKKESVKQYSPSQMECEYDEDIRKCCYNYDLIEKYTSEDEVFLLSMPEIVNYCSGKNYAYQGFIVENVDSYWLRDAIGSRKLDGSIRVVHKDGRIGAYNCHFPISAVRPALYIKAQAIKNGEGSFDNPYSLSFYEN